MTKFIYTTIRVFIIVMMLFVYVLPKTTYGQNIPYGVTKIVEDFLLKDSTNTVFLDLVKNKTYILKTIQSVKYKSMPTTIYVFGDVTAHIFFYNLLFVDNTSNKFFIIGTEKTVLNNVVKLRDTLATTDEITAENVKLCYGYIIENYSDHGELIRTIKK